METKELCKSCGGVINGKVYDSETGERPCTCNKEDIQLEIHWKNGRELHNSKGD